MDGFRTSPPLPVDAFVPVIINVYQRSKQTCCKGGSEACSGIPTAMGRIAKDGNTFVCFFQCKVVATCDDIAKDAVIEKFVFRKRIERWIEEAESSVRHLVAKGDDACPLRSSCAGASDGYNDRSVGL